MKIVKAPKMIAKRLSTCLGALALATLTIAGCNSSHTPAADQTTTAQTQTAATSPVNIKPEANEAAEPAHTWTTDQILTCTVSQCWHLANKSEDEFFDIVQELAATSAKNRNITLPQSAEAGQKVGEIIKNKAKSDHEQLLYAVVDDAVRQVGKSAPAK
jgi:hypothetical protein